MVPRTKLAALLMTLFVAAAPVRSAVHVEVDSGDRPGSLRRFAVTVPDGTLVGSIRSDEGPGAIRVDLDLDGANDPITLRLAADFERPGVADVEVVLAAGSVSYRLGDGPPRVMASSIVDCDAVRRSPTYRAVLEALPAVGAAATRTFDNTRADRDLIAWTSVLLALAAEAPRLEERCEDAGLTPAGVCSWFYEWEEDCVDCCNLAFIVSRTAGVGICAAAGASFCSPSTVGSAACGGVAAAACYAAAELAKVRCRASCSPKPKRPDDGDACGDGGTCKDYCESDEVVTPGDCSDGNVCCAPGL